jgi:hypothetical protein
VNDWDWHALTHDSTVTLPTTLTRRSSVREDTKSLSSNQHSFRQVDIDKGRDVPIAASRGPPAGSWHDRGSDGIRPRKIVQIEKGRSAT